MQQVSAAISERVLILLTAGCRLSLRQWTCSRQNKGGGKEWILQVMAERSKDW